MVRVLAEYYVRSTEGALVEVTVTPALAVHAGSRLDAPVEALETVCGLGGAFATLNDPALALQAERMVRLGAKAPGANAA